MSSQLIDSLHDLASIFTHMRLWLHLGWIDIRQRYIGSLLGPFWITLSLSIFLIALSIVYTRLLHQPIETYLPFLTCGLLTWAYIAGVVTDSCTTFVNAKPYIYQIKLPLSLFAYRVIWRNVVIFAHNLIVYIVVVFFFKVKMTMNTLFFIPGFLLITFCLIPISLLVALISTRYRDLPPIIASIIQVLFFVSPITWLPHLVGESSRIITYNPITYMVDLVRSPLLGDMPLLKSWDVIITLTILLFIFTIPLFSFKKNQIVYWL